MLATNDNLKHLDAMGPSTRIMGLGFQSNGGDICRVPCLSNKPEKPGDDLGRFWYVADVGCDTNEPAIWNVLTYLLFHTNIETLHNIRTGNGKPWPPPQPPVLPPVYAPAIPINSLLNTESHRSAA